MQYQVRMWHGAAVAALLGTVGCGSDTEGPANVDSAEDDTVSFERVRTEVFELSCAGGGCHGAASAAGKLVLEGDADTVHGELLDAPCDNPDAIARGLPRVDPGSPDNSFLYIKLTEPQGMGGPMPPFGALPADQLEMVELWILDGAQR